MKLFIMRSASLSCAVCRGGRERAAGLYKKLLMMCQTLKVRGIISEGARLKLVQSEKHVAHDRK
ncbi:hypothetical protein DPMN_158171 [Dreissena polymorpha]|uniref:Uncharacterized protein n=1 Tax=Dreissena polymorpha TaxID=45954 RepID=A0A9D4EJC3_DREPO|nr:hypothetical protein DPMN_158171 [Dreissena polymorpha]